MAAQEHGSLPSTRERGRQCEFAAQRAGLTDTGELERTILVVRAAGGSVRNFAGHDLVAALQRRIPANGSVSEQVNWTAFGVLALRSAGVRPPGTMIRWIAAQQGVCGRTGEAKAMMALGAEATVGS